MGMGGSFKHRDPEGVSDSQPISLTQGAQGLGKLLAGKSQRYMVRCLSNTLCLNLKQITKKQFKAKAHNGKQS